MTVKLYDTDPYLKEFTATVIDSYPKADGYFTILDQTAFFPEGGGQAADIGMLNDAKVYDVQISDGIIYHYTTEQFQKGERVFGVLNFERRFDFMQQHSGEHIVSGVAHGLFGCENVGFHLGKDIVTLDFDKYLEREQLLQIERKANEAVQRNVKFRTYYPDAETLSKLSYRSKKELEGDIRIVEIEDTDMCACCAPHVNTAGEIGLIKLLDSEKLRGGVRIELKCGMRALDDYNEKFRNTARIGALLSVKQHETADAAAKLYEQLTAEKQERTVLKKRICDMIIASADEQMVLFADGLDIKELQIISDGLHKKTGGIHAVFSAADSGFAFAICGNAQETDGLFARFRDEFAVRGGGRNGMVQGTVQASEGQIKLFFHI